MDKEKNLFTKPPLSLDEQITLFETRGLTIPDREKATAYLKFIGYYRLSVYCKPYQIENDPDHHFQEGVSFNHILLLYIFDRQLRLLVMDAIERIEVAFRAIVNDHMSLKYGSQWYEDCRLFQRPQKNFNHLQLLRLIQKETGFHHTNDGPSFCRAYYRKYHEPALPPSWMVSEVLPLGSWSRIYSVLTEPEDRKFISNAFRVRYKIFGSWIHAVSYLRNVCAHHSLLWNATFTVKPSFTNEVTNVISDNKFYAQAFVLQYFLNNICIRSTWGQRLKQHIQSCPLSHSKHMGFPDRWWEHEIWTTAMSPLK
ncbi:MAG TPA: Abi family protein [Solidesulfovibrio magneticus]|nr:Abi family protein [Solidesulfovibrio magneticus]